MGFLKKVRRVSKKIFPLGVSAAIVVAMIIPQAFAASTATSDATSPNSHSAPISTSGQNENTNVILPPPTRREKVQFYDANNKVISEQWVVNNDKITNIGEPPTLPDKTFAFWALDDGSDGWQAKPYDFNQKVVLNERNQEGVFEDSSHVLKLYPQYKEKITINFILLKDQVNQPKDKVYYSFNERLADCTSHESDEVQSLDTTRGCSFGDYEKDVRPFLPAGEYVAGWTTVRADAVAKNEQSKEHNDYEIRSSKNYYAIIKKGYIVSFESNGGNIVPSATTSPNTAVKKPKDPTKRGYVFKEWSTSPTEDIPYNFATPVNQNIKLYAVWDKGDSSYTVELLVEDTVDDNGKPLPLYYNMYSFNGQFLGNSLKTSNPQDVINAANTQRKGAFRVQKITMVTTKPDGQHYKTGDKVDPATVCAPFKKEYAGFTIVPPQNPVQNDGEVSQVNEGLKPDGSTEFICKAERPRGALTMKIATSFTRDDRPNPFTFQPTEPDYIVYYGLLSQVGNFNGEYLGSAFEKSQEIFSKNQELQDVKVRKNLSDSMKWYQDTTTPKPSNTEPPVLSDFGTYFGGVYYSLPPYFSIQPGTETTNLQGALSGGNALLVSLFREVDNSTIASKTTNWYSYYNQMGNTVQPSDYFDHMKKIIGLSNADNPENSDYHFPESAQVEDDSVRPLNIIQDNVAQHFTRVDHVAIPGFKRIFYSYPESKDEAQDSFYTSGNKKYNLGGTYALKSDSNLPAFLRQKARERVGAKASNFIYKISIFPYKRLSYNMYFETFDGHKDYHLWVPYNYSIKETIDKKWTQEDVPHAIDEINGLKDYMKKYVPNVTRRADGAVFKGWCYSLDCKPSEVMNTEQLFEKTRMPYYDMYIVAIWNNYKRRLRVFNNAKDYSKFYAQTYANGYLIQEPDYTAEALVPPLQAQTSKDLLGWLWRPRYIIGHNEDGTKRYRNGSWRVYNPKKSVEMFFDVDMRPLWRIETLNVTYLPGQTDASGHPTGPQGTGTVEQPFVYSVLTDAVVQKNAFTAPSGYMFGGWTDENGNVLHANDNVHMYYNRVLKALWIPVPSPVGLTYNSNYPQELHKENKTQTVGYTNGHPTLENNTRTIVADLPQGWAPAGYMFDGWQDTPQNDTATRFTVGTNSVVLNNRHQNVLYARWKKNTNTFIYVHKVRYENPQVFSGNVVDLPGAGFELYARDIYGSYIHTGKDNTVVQAEIVADTYCAPKTTSTAAASTMGKNSAATSDTHTAASDTTDVPSGACFRVPLDLSIQQKYESYALSESQAPEGYEKLAVPILFTVDANTGNVVLQESQHNVPQVTVQGGNVIQVVDIPRQPLPLSGGRGIYAWIGLSAALILAAMGVLFASRKKENK